MPAHLPSKTQYSDKYTDDVYEFRHVTLNAESFEKLPEKYRSFYAKLRSDDPYVKNESHWKYEREMQLLSETDWTAAGVRVSAGW